MGSGFRPRHRSTRLIGAGLLAAAALVLAGCSEVASNKVESQPYSLEPTDNPDIQRVKLEDRIAENIDLQTAEVTSDGAQKVVPYTALIYNPEGNVFVYTKPEPQVYVRAPVTVDSIVGEIVALSDGPPAGTVVVTTGAAELLATEYEILNQHP